MRKNDTKVYNTANSYAKAPHQHRTKTGGKVERGNDLRAKKNSKPNG